MGRYFSNMNQWTPDGSDSISDSTCTSEKSIQREGLESSATHFYIKPAMFVVYIEIIVTLKDLCACWGWPWFRPLFSDGVSTVLPGAISNLLFPWVFAYAFKQNEFNKSPAEGAQRNITSFILSCVCVSAHPNNQFLHYVLIWSQIDPKWFCLWGKQTEKWELLSQEEKEKRKKENHSRRFFKVPWQQNIQKNFDENSRQRGADYKGDNLLLQLQEQQSLIAHTYTSIELYSKCGPLCKNTVLFCPITALQSEDERVAAEASRCRDEGLSLGCCCNKASLAASVGIVMWGGYSFDWQCSRMSTRHAVGVDFLFFLFLFLF